MTPRSNDRAGAAYWEAAWERRALPPRFEPEARHLTACVDRAFNDFFTRSWEGISRTEAKPSLLEVGCGASALLPFFAQRHGFSVSGLDYSPEGVAQSRALLARDGVQGEVHMGDLFAPPEELLGRFDVVFTNGLVEHFEDTAGCVRALSRFARKGGRLVTVIPNLAGAMGRVQRFLDREVYDAHVIVDRERLGGAHASAGLSVVQCDYFLAINFGVCQVSKVTNPAERLFKRGLHRVLVDVSRGVWRYESLAGPLPARKNFSPYITCVAVC